MRRLIGSILTVFLVTACNEAGESGTQTSNDPNLATAEVMIDAFYSFDPMQLEATLLSAAESSSSILYYQGWAEGGNYKILNRKPCELKAADTVSCSITVADDPMLALGIDFNVTDTFTISFSNNKISAVETSSDDMQIYYDARDWVREQLPELIEEPCQGYFAGGPTPGDCARAMADGYAQFAASDDFNPL